MTTATKSPHEGSMADVKNGNSAPSPPSPPPPSPASSFDEESALPIDRGYAWVIVFACLLINVICLGFQRSYGVLFVAFLDLFSMPVGVTSLIMAVQSAFTSVSALMTQTVMLSLMTERRALIIGALFGSAGIILSYFASTIFLLILTQSVLVGIANGMIMGPTMVIVGKYFYRHRSLAMAVAILGGNLGSMLMPLLTEALLDRFGVRGALLILGACFLHIVVFAGLLRPLRPVAVRSRADSTTADPQPEKPRPDLEELKEDPDRRGLVEGQKRSSADLLESTHLCVSTPELSMAAKISLTDLKDNDDDNDDDDDENDDENSEDEDHKDNEKDGYELQPLKSDEAKEDPPSHTNLHNNNNNSHNRYHHHHHHNNNNNNDDDDDNENSNDSNDDDSHDDKPDPHSNLQSTTTSTTKNKKKQKQKKKKKKKKGCGRKFLAMFDLSLFKRPNFLLVTSSCSLAFLPAALFGMYLPAMAVDKGVSGHQAALLLTVFGGCGIVSRLGFGYLADKNCMRRAYLMALLMTLTSVAGLFTPLYNDFPMLAFFSVTYGLFGIVFFSLMPVVIVDLMGLDNMSMTLGFVQLFQGVVITASHPIIGHLRDVTGSYHASYYFMSASGLCCAFLLLFTPFVTTDHGDSLEL